MKLEELAKLFPGKLALDREEAAEAIGLSPITLDRLTKRGLLQPSRATRKPLYPIWELARFLQDTSCQGL